VFSVYASLPVALLFFHARSLDLIALGDEPAHHLGVEVDRLRRVVYLSTALLTAASVATCGIIGFVGLVVPHAVRTVFRPLHSTLLPLVFLVGGCFLVLADVVSRTAVRPLELPVGVITALIGVPLFAVLLRRTLA
jgi:iron complex transport system permease protein